MVVDTFLGREGPQTLRVPDGLFDLQGLNQDQVPVVVVNPTLNNRKVAALGKLKW